MILGNYLLPEGAIILHKHHLYRATERGDDFDWAYSPVWTFRSTLSRYIRFHFTEFDCYTSYNCFVRIGNFLQSNESTLFEYRGRSLSCDVISTSNTAWLKVDPCLRRANALGTDLIRFGIEVSQTSEGRNIVLH